MSCQSPSSAGFVVAWRLLSLGLATPTEERLAEIRLLAEALAEYELVVNRDERSPIEGSALAALREHANDEVSALAAAHQRLFGGAVQVAPYEGSYEADPFRAARVMADVAGFYRAFGADAGGPAAERVDHAGCELEFLAYLGARRLAALEAGDGEAAERCLEIEEAFLVDHAGRWLPTFFRQLAAAADDGFYALVGLLGEELVTAELTRRGLEPAPLGQKRRRLAVEEDAFECGAADLADPLGAAVDTPQPRRRRR